MKNVKRDLPISLAFSIILITVVYVFTIISYYSALTKIQIINSEAIAITFGNSLYYAYGYFMSAAVVCSMFGAANGLIFTTSRVVFIAARHRHMPKVLNTINLRSETPIAATIFTGLLSMGYTFFNDTLTLLNYTSIMNWLAVVTSVIALLYFRRKWPDLHRPLKVPLIIPITFIFLVSILIIASVIAAPVEAGIGSLITLSAIPIYWIGNLILANNQKLRARIGLFAI